MNPVKRSVAILFSILLMGSLGYMIIEGSSFLDGLYMTVITITTVGFSETIPLGGTGKIFTIILILVGVSFVLYVFGKITEAVVEGGLKKAFGRINMDKKVARLQDHYIVCGYGRIGKVICKSLKDSKKSFVVIENNPDEIQLINQNGYMFVEGEAADDDILMKAGVSYAKALIAVVSSDAENVYITLSAKEMNPDLFVMGRSSGKEGAETKLLRAGADKVISPYYIGARQMANTLLKPTVVDFLDLAVHAGDLGLQMEELTIPATSRYVNMTLMESEIRKDYDIILAAIKRKGDKAQMIFNPSHLTKIEAGDVVILLGDASNVKRFASAL